jgi:hypothetical protein
MRIPYPVHEFPLFRCRLKFFLVDPTLYNSRGSLGIARSEVFFRPRSGVVNGDDALRSKQGHESVKGGLVKIKEMGGVQKNQIDGKMLEVARADICLGFEKKGEVFPMRKVALGDFIGALGERRLLNQE